MGDLPVILSYGGGRQTVALCILVRKGIVPRPDRIVIADTGREKGSTWDWMERFTGPLMREIGLEIEVAPHGLATVDLYAHNGDMLMPLYTATGKLDPFCTGEWKQQVVARYLRSQGIAGGTKLIGFALDEGKRIRGLSTKGKWKPAFPLAELCLTKANCIRIVEDFGWPVPPPSSCWMCPNMRNAEWREVRANRPDEFEKACQVDEELRAYDLENAGTGVWVHHSCVPLREADLEAPDLKVIHGRQCSFGDCFV